MKKRYVVRKLGSRAVFAIANPYSCLKFLSSLIGRGPLGQKVAKNAFSWHPSGKHLVCGLFERHIGTLPPKKVPKRKTCQILRKWMICDYLLLNCITAKKFEILNSTITKTTCIMNSCFSPQL